MKSRYKPNQELQFFIHDIASPITNIDLSLQLIKQSTSEFHQTELETLVNRAMKSINNINHLIHLNRSYKKASSIRTFSPLWLVRKLINENHSNIISQQNISISIVGSNNQMINGNKDAFSKVLDNIISNSIDSFTTYKTINPKLKFRCTTLGGKIIITIRDNGPGIKPENINKIFTKNFSTKHRHIGVGLFISKRIIEKEFHGMIKVTSKLGSFTEFKITVPK